MNVGYQVVTGRFTAPPYGQEGIAPADLFACWLSETLRGEGFDAVDPWPEDCGFALNILHRGRAYLVVCSSIPADGRKPGNAFAVRVYSATGLIKRLLGLWNSRRADDPVAAVIQSLLMRQPDFRIASSDA